MLNTSKCKSVMLLKLKLATSGSLWILQNGKDGIIYIIYILTKTKRRLSKLVALALRSPASRKSVARICELTHWQWRSDWTSQMSVKRFWQTGAVLKTLPLQMPKCSQVEETKQYFHPSQPNSLQRKPTPRPAFLCRSTSARVLGVVKAHAKSYRPRKLLYNSII